MPQGKPHESMLATTLPSLVLFATGILMEIWTVSQHQAMNIPGIVLIVPAICLGIWSIVTPTKAMVRVSWIVVSVCLIIGIFQFVNYLNFMEFGVK